MAKHNYLSQSKLEKALFARTEGYAANVRSIYQKALSEIIDLVKGTELEDGVPFSFKEYGYSEDVTPILRRMYSETYQAIRTGVGKEWLNANANNDELVKAVFGEKSIEDNHFAKYFKRNQDAMDAFFARKTEGLNLSQKVWNLTGHYKDELENSLDLAIGEGTPAMKMASKIKGYLNDPERYYRRFRYKTGEDEAGNPIYGLKWKRRVWDKESESYKWIDAKPSKYRSGKGVYRSSARNAQRLARTETNIAYREADYLRWQDEEFVIGVEIKLSNNHPVSDICDDLAGVYPKNFKWTGWHPNCRCYMSPVLAKEKEIDNMLSIILDGGDPGDVSVEGKVTELPDQFTSWMEDNKARVEAATQKGTLPYFIKDNLNVINPPELSPKEIAKMRHNARTPEDIERIRTEWNVRKATYQYGNNVLGIMGGISDVDTSALSEALKHADQKLVLQEAAKLKQIGKQIYALDLLDNPMAVAKQFSLADAEVVQNAVKTKLNTILIGSLKNQISSLRFEIDWVTNKKKYYTWEVASKAYEKAYAGVKKKIAVEEIKKSLTPIEQFLVDVPKSKKVKALYAQINEALDKMDLDKAKILTGDATKEVNKYLQKKIKKELGSSPKELEKYIEEHYITNFTVNSQESYERVMKMLGDATKDAWLNATDEQRGAFPYYTNDSSHSMRILTNVGLGKSEPKAKLMDAILDKISTTEDMVLRSGQDYDVAGFVFGKDFQNALKSGDMDVLNKQYAGSVGINKSYMSTSFNEKGGFSKDFEIHIYAPKGTHCINLNEISYYGHDKGVKWDGYSYHPTWSTYGETEIFLHRGYKWKFIKAEAGTGMSGRNRIYVQLLDRVE